MRNVSDKIYRENQNTHFVFSKFFFLKTLPFIRYVEKYCTTGQATIWHYNACALHAGYLRLQTHTQNM